MESTLSKFAQNKQEMMTPILPAHVNGPSISNISSLSTHFSAAVENNVYPPAVAEPQQAGMSMADKQNLAASGNAVGATLADKSQMQGIKVQEPQSTMGYLAGSALKMGSELGSELMNMFGSPKQEEPEPTFRPQAPRPGMGLSPQAGGLF